MSQRSSHQHIQINNQPQLTAVCRHSEESCAAARRVVAPRRRVESRPALSAVLAAAAAVADTGEHGRGGAAHLPAAVPRRATEIFRSCSWLGAGELEMERWTPAPSILPPATAQLMTLLSGAWCRNVAG